jgi:hypothetical protein
MSNTKANNGNGQIRDPMRIATIRRDADGLHITLLADPSLVLDGTGQPLPKSAALAAIRAHIAKARRGA